MDCVGRWRGPVGEAAFRPAEGSRCWTMNFTLAVGNFTLQTCHDAPLAYRRSRRMALPVAETRALPGASVGHSAHFTLLTLPTPWGAVGECEV